MGKKNKLQRFAELKLMPNVLECPDPVHPILYKGHGEEADLKGRWAEKQFSNENSIVLELACGRGEYTLALARQHPEKNFIGVDIKGARIWKGANRAIKESLPNVAFLRTRIERIDIFFASSEVEEMWITFPDPFPKPSDENRRLTSNMFLDKYAKILEPEGVVHLKTDDDQLYAYTLETVENHPHWEVLTHSDDIYSEKLQVQELEHKTYYELKHLKAGKTIKYIHFKRIRH